MCENSYEVVVVGAGPAGLAAAVGLVRNRVKTLLLDAARPRHSATLKSHGFITRDGASPLEIRNTGRQEFLTYPDAAYSMARVTDVSRIAADTVDFSGEQPGRLEITAAAVRGGAEEKYTARRIIVATGLVETLPTVPEFRAYYGTAIHSCVTCDSYEKSGAPVLFLLSNPDVAVADVARQLRHLCRLSPEVVLCRTAAVPEGLLSAAAVAADRSTVTVLAEPVAEFVGEHAKLQGVRLGSGEVYPVTAGFVNCSVRVASGWLDSLQPDTGINGALCVSCGTAETSIPGVYAVGEAATGSPEQLLVAAGSGARAVPEIIASLET